MRRHFELSQLYSAGLLTLSLNGAEFIWSMNQLSSATLLRQPVGTNCLKAVSFTVTALKKAIFVVLQSEQKQIIFCNYFESKDLFVFLNCAPFSNKHTVSKVEEENIVSLPTDFLGCCTSIEFKASTCTNSHSTKTTLLETSTSLLRRMNKYENILVISLYFSAAFVTVDIDFLVNKLNKTDV